MCIFLGSVRLSSDSASFNESQSSESHEEDDLNVETQQQQQADLAAPEYSVESGVVGLTESVLCVQKITLTVPKLVTKLKNPLYSRKRY